MAGNPRNKRRTNSAVRTGLVRGKRTDEGRSNVISIQTIGLYP